MALPGGNDIEFKLVKNCMDTNKEYIKKVVQYSCGQCDYQATWKGHLKIHIDSVRGASKAYIFLQFT